MSYQNSPYGAKNLKDLSKMDLITAKEVVGKLKQGGTANISTAYFSKLVTIGHIPYHTVAGKKRKMFKYEEAKKALIQSQDPSRDAQREANVLAKENKEINNSSYAAAEKKSIIQKEIDYLNAKYISAKKLSDMRLSDFNEYDMTDTDTDDLERTLDEIISTNLSIFEIIDEHKEFFRVNFGFENEVIKTMNFEVLKISVEKLMTVDDFLDYTGLSNFKKENVAK